MSKTDKPSAQCAHCSDTFSQRLNHTVASMVDRVHVCGHWPFLTYILLAHAPTILSLFYTVWPDPFGPYISPFWAQHHTLKIVLLFTMALNFMHTHSAA